MKTPLLIITAALCALPAAASETTSKNECAQRFLFAEKIMRKYMRGETLPALLYIADRDKERQKIVDDAFNYQVPKLTTDKLHQANMFAIKHEQRCLTVKGNVDESI